MDAHEIRRARNNVTAPLGRALGLPNGFYTDRDYHRREARELFSHTWTCVGVGAEIPGPGDIKPVSAAGMPLILIRTPTAEIKAFHNVCSHRGVQLVTEPQNRRPVIRCPYHSWTYGLDGRLVQTPMLDPDLCPGGTRYGHGLVPVEVALWNDLVFVNLDGTAPPLADFMAPLDARWSAYDFSGLRHTGTWSLELAANWKLAMENYLESYHLPWIHPGLNDRSPLEQHRHVVVSESHFGQVTDRFAAGRITSNPLPPFPGLTEAQEQAGEYPIVFPNVMLGLQRDHFYCIIVEAIAVDRTCEHVHLYLASDETDDPCQATAARDLIENWKAVFVEDIWVVERMQMGRASAGFDGGILTPQHDDLTHLFMKQVIKHLT